MNIKEITLSSPIEKKIHWAEHCYKSFSGTLIQDKTIVDYLTRIEDAIQASHKEMGETGILDICTDCEKNEGGTLWVRTGGNSRNTKKSHFRVSVNPGRVIQARHFAEIQLCEPRSHNAM